MGQAFDKDGAILGEAYGQTKRDVFEKLSAAHPDAAEIRIRTIGPSDSAAQMGMPRYRCHKEVHALKIVGVIDSTTPGHESDGSRVLVVEAPYAPVLVDREYVRKHAPTAGGYYVLYDDGYRSFSPAGAFEGGYTRL